MAAHDRDKAMAGLLQRTLRADAGSQDPCPGPDVLAAYYERSLAPDEMPVCELHISRCARCRAQLSLMARTEAQSAPCRAARLAFGLAPAGRGNCCPDRRDGVGPASTGVEIRG